MSLGLIVSALSVMGQSKMVLDSLLRDNEEVPQVLIVGTFHFGYPNLDAHKTDDANKIDINSPQRQKEVDELVDYIARFKPSKILVEAGKNTGYLVHQYNLYKKGEVKLRKKEIDQIGFRLMDQFKLDTLYGIDASSLARELRKQSNPLNDRIYKEVPDSLFESTFEDQYWKWYEIQDKNSVEMPLLDCFKEMNSEHHINRMHGHYLLSDKTTNYNATDGLAINWYNRNLRIFKNMQMVETDHSDRLLILIGQGHVPILKHLFVSSPEYDFINFSDLENIKP